MDSKQLAKIANKKGAIQKAKELSALISLLKKRKLYTIVEIGTYKGGTLYSWCKIAEPNAIIISIDLPGGLFGGGHTIEEMKKFKNYGKKNQKFYFLKKDSHLLKTRNELIKLLKEKEIDFLMIDGDHTFKGAKKDWDLYSPLVKQNGIIALHDIVHHTKVPECQVDRLWRLIKKQHKYKELIDPKDIRTWGPWGGIGVIYYKVNG
jgi:predicted O-methyltransferase YrrM